MLELNPRGDLLALLAAAACLHWFNPLVWVMLVLANRDLELSCDAAVVRLYGAEARAPYARTLLEARRVIPRPGEAAQPA